MARFNKRSIVLASILVGIVVLCWGESLISNHLIGPIRESERRVDLLRDSVAIETDKYERICEAERRLEEFRAKSLPVDTSVAATLYQNWLVEQVSKAGWRHGIVTPNRVSQDENNYSRIPFTITAKCELDELCDFLFEFHRTQMLHKIKEVKIEARSHESNPLLSLSLQVEAIAIPSAHDQKTLPDLGKLDHLAEGDRHSYSLISERNPFERGAGKKVAVNKQPAPPVHRNPVADPSIHVFYVGAIIKDDSREAYLYDRSKKKHYVLKEGEPFEIHGVKGDVVEITPGAIGLNVDGESVEIALAGNLGRSPDAAFVGGAGELSTESPPEFNSDTQSVSIREEGGGLKFDQEDLDELFQADFDDEDFDDGDFDDGDYSLE